MLLATWNINGIRARSMRLTEWLAERKPDVACLQELKITEEEFPHLELRASGYYATLLGQAGWNGVAVIAKERPEPVLAGLPGGEAHGSRFIVTRVHGIEVASAYIPNGKSVKHPDFNMKLGWLESLAKYIETRDKSIPFLLAGDFNACPEDLDSWGGVKFRGHIHHTEEERALVARLKAAGLVDLYRTRYPEEPGYSWWDYRAGSFHKKQGLRIDLLFASASLAGRVTDVYVDREYRKKGKPSGSIPSDHAPVVAVVDDAISQ